MLNTQFQKQMVEAICSSPEVFFALKRNAKNRQAFNQQLNRIWPFKAKVNKTLKGKTIHPDAIYRLLLSIAEDLAKSEVSDLHPESYTIIAKNLNEVKIEAFKIFEFLKQNSIKMYAKDEVIRSSMSEIRNNGNNMIKELEWSLVIPNTSDVKSKCNARLCAFEIQDDYIGMNAILNFFMLGLISLLENSIISNTKNVTVSVQFELIGAQRMADKVGLVLNRMLEHYRVQNKSKKKVHVRKSTTLKAQNVGIEIEYHGKFTPLKDKLISMGSVSFASGVDGSDIIFEDNPRYPTERDINRRMMELERLSENRLRINGFYSLNALKYLLWFMDETGRDLASNSGIHFHVDCSAYLKCFNTINKKALFSLSLMHDLILTKLTEPETRKSAGHSLSVIFKMDEEKVFEAIKYTIARKNDFGTLEWRFIYPSLKYSVLMPQMLACIHLTNCGIFTNKPVDLQYLEFLARMQERNM